jgi:hypothetical protein
MIKTFKTNEEFNCFLIDDKFIMHELIVNAIEYSFYTNEEYAAILEAYVEEKNNSFMIGITKPEWLGALDKSLKYFERVEEYEMCEIVFTLIKEIKNNEPNLSK